MARFTISKVSAMRRFYHSLSWILFAGIFVVACTQVIDSPEFVQENIQPKGNDGTMQKIIITATVEDEIPDTKTMLGPGKADGKFNWTPGDEINLIFGSGYGDVFTTSESFTEPAPRAQFEGYIHAVTGVEAGEEEDLKFWGIFPYNQSNQVVKQDDEYYADIVFPSIQTAFDYDSNTWELGPTYGSWGKDQFPYIGQSGNMLIGFRMIGGGLRFYLTRDDITEIRFRGANYEAIAGECMVKMENGVPSKPTFNSQNSTSEIVLKAPNNGTFKKSEGNTKYYYYLSIPPQVFPDGYVITAYAGAESGVRAFTGERTVTRQKITGWSTVALDDTRYMTWHEVLPQNKEILYTVLNDNSEHTMQVAFNRDGVHHTADDNISNEWDPDRECYVITFDDELIELDDYAFGGAINLKTITLPDRLEVIGNAAFLGTYNLSDIDFGTSLTTIGYRAFLMNGMVGTGLTDIALPPSIRFIGEGAFQSCPDLESITLPEGLQYIGADAFYGCSSLESITLPSTLLGIGVEVQPDANPKNVGTPIAGSHGASPFAYCTNLKAFYGSGANFSTTNGNRYLLSDNDTFLIAGALGSLTTGGTLPSVVEVGENAFRGINGSRINFHIPNSVTTLRKYCFANAGTIMGIDIGNQVAYIMEGAFSNTNCTNGITVKGDNLPSIENNAFANDSQINITGYAAVSNNCLGSGLWLELKQAHRINPSQDQDEIWYHKTDNDNTGLINIDNSLNFGSTDEPAYALEEGFFNPDQFGSFRSSIPVPFEIDAHTAIAVQLFDSVVTEIPAGAFSNQSKLDFVSLSYRTKVINNSAFQSDAELLCFPLGANAYNLNYLGDYAFYNCSKMAFPKEISQLNMTSLTSLGASTFEGCSVFGSSMPDATSTLVMGQIPEVPARAFKGCEKLNRIIINNARLSNDNETADAVNSITAIGMEAFMDCSNLIQINSYALRNEMSINLPGVTTVNAQAFYNCSSLETIALPGIVNLGERAFAFTRSLQTLTLGPNLTAIGLGDSLFYDDDPNQRNESKVTLYLQAANPSFWDDVFGYFILDYCFRYNNVIDNNSLVQADYFKFFKLYIPVEQYQDGYSDYPYALDCFIDNTVSGSGVFPIL